MKLLRIAGALGALAVSMAVAAPASATIWLLNLTDAQSGLPSPYGQVEVTQGVNALNFTVTLFDGLKFTDTGMGHSAFTFSLAGEPAIGFTGLPAGFTTFTSANAIQNSPFAFFDYAVTCTDTCRPSIGGYASPLTFTVTGAGLTLASLATATGTFMGQTVLFAADTISTTGVTGTVAGGPLAGGVPEPATWAMMILGMGMVGMGLRLRRRPDATPA